MAGAHLTLMARSEDELRQARDAIRAEGVACDHIAMDVTDSQAVSRMVADRGPFEVLVNSAGMNRPKRPSARRGFHTRAFHGEGGWGSYWPPGGRGADCKDARCSDYARARCRLRGGCSIKYTIAQAFHWMLAKHEPCSMRYRPYRLTKNGGFRTERKTVVPLADCKASASSPSKLWRALMLAMVAACHRPFE